jgi:hypothetical protein
MGALRFFIVFGAEYVDLWKLRRTHLGKKPRPCSEERLYLYTPR